MRRIVLGFALALMASAASAQVTQTGSVFWNGGWAPPQPTTQYLQSCNGGAGGIVGQGSCTAGGGSGAGFATTPDQGPGATTANTLRVIPATDANLAKETGGNLAIIATNTNGVASAANQTTINTTLGTLFKSGQTIGNTGFNALQGGAANSLTNPFYVAPATGASWTVSGNVGGLETAGSALTGGGLRMMGSDGTNAQDLKTNTTGNLQIAGNVGSGATDSGFPVKVGGVYNSPQPTFTTGQRGDMQLDSRGNQLVSISSGGFQAYVLSNPGDALANGDSALLTTNFGRVFNGTSWDRTYSIQGDAATGNAGLGVQAVEEGGRTYSHVNTATTTTSKNGKGFLHTFCNNTPVASSSATAYDNTAGSGTVLFAITLPATLVGEGPNCATYDLAFTTGLTVVTTGTGDWTWTWR